LLTTLTPASLLPGALDALRDVRERGVRIALASASHNARTIIERLGIADAFDYIADPANSGRPKPAPDIFLAAAAALGPTRALHRRRRRDRGYHGDQAGRHDGDRHRRPARAGRGRRRGSKHGNAAASAIPMRISRIVVALVLIYMLFAVLLNSVGTVILQSIATFGVDKPVASLLEACKDLTIAAFSFVVASFLPALGYRRALMLSLAIVGSACVLMPLYPGFHTTEFLFVCVGASFAMTKVAVYSSIGLLTSDKTAHSR
jgi:hypothetical protein